MTKKFQTGHHERKNTTIRGEAMEIITRKATPPTRPEARYKPLAPSQTILKAGYQHLKGALPLPCDILFERDVAIKLRDGVTIYIDVYRPTDSSISVPAVLNWAPYGKGQTGIQDLDNGKLFPFRFGIPRKALSGLQ